MPTTIVSVSQEIGQRNGVWAPFSASGSRAHHPDRVKCAAHAKLWNWLFENGMKDFLGPSELRTQLHPLKTHRNPHRLCVTDAQARDLRSVQEFGDFSSGSNIVWHTLTARFFSIWEFLLTNHLKPCEQSSPVEMKIQQGAERGRTLSLQTAWNSPANMCAARLRLHCVVKLPAQDKKSHLQRALQRNTYAIRKSFVQPVFETAHRWILQQELPSFLTKPSVIMCYHRAFEVTFILLIHLQVTSLDISFPLLELCISTNKKNCRWQEKHKRCRNALVKPKKITLSQSKFLRTPRNHSGSHIGVMFEILHCFFRCGMTKQSQAAHARRVKLQQRRRRTGCAALRAKTSVLRKL